MEEKDADTDSSNSDFDEVDGLISKAKRKIFRFFKPKKRTLDHPEGVKAQQSVNRNVVMGDQSYVYDFNHKERGICVIISNEKFLPGQGLNNRDSSKKDVKMLTSAFEKLNFFVKVYTDLTGVDIEKKLRKVAQKYDHLNADCLACIVLSHGGSDVVFNKKRRTKEKIDYVLGTDGEKIAVKFITSLFNDDGCPDLMRKPRIFLLQACRGYQMEKGVNIKVLVDKTAKLGTKSARDRPDSSEQNPIDSSDARPETEQEKEQAKRIQRPTHPASIVSDENEVILDEEDDTDGSSTIVVTSPSPCYMDSLVMFASPPGYFAFLRTSGSWLMKSLSESIIEDKSLQINFVKILTKTSCKMARDYISNNSKNPDIDKCKVVPCMMSSLTKDIIFTPRPVSRPRPGDRPVLE